MLNVVSYIFPVGFSYSFCVTFESLT